MSFLFISEFHLCVLGVFEAIEHEIKTSGGFSLAIDTVLVCYVVGGLLCLLLPPFPFSSALWHKSSHSPPLQQFIIQCPQSTQSPQPHVCPPPRVRQCQNTDGLIPLYGMNWRGGGGPVGGGRNRKDPTLPCAAILAKRWKSYQHRD